MLRSRFAAKALREERGFTLLEVMAVVAVLGILMSIVAGSITSAMEGVDETTLNADSKIISTAASGFFAQASPRIFPVVEPNDSLEAANDAETLTVKLIDFDAHLPQDETKTFVPDFLRDIPRTASLVSWQVDTATGAVFFSDDSF